MHHPQLEFELEELFDHLSELAIKWDTNEIIPKLLKLQEIIYNQLNSKYSEEKYRIDKNEILNFLERIEKFNQFNLPITIEHLQQIIQTTKSKIRPYPHYSGLKVSVPQNL